MQLPYNMLQRDIEQRTLPWCRANGIAVTVYWPLMKGLLAGKLPRDHQFDARDKRQTMPMYQGDEWQKNQDFVDALRGPPRSPATPWPNWSSTGRSTSPASRPPSAARNAPTKSQKPPVAMSWELTPEQRLIIDAAITARGYATAKRSFV